LAENYQFQSIEIKELSFRIDGLFLPHEQNLQNPIYFVEVQFQKDQDFYWRFFTENILYLNQYKPNHQWQAVVLWGKRSYESELPLAYQIFAPLLQPIYLDEIEQSSDYSLGLGIIQFIVSSAKKASKQIKTLINQTHQKIPDPITQKKVIELIEKIVIYKFPQLSNKELEAMFTLTEWKQTKFYQEAKEEGKLETIPILIQLGLSLEEIAEKLNLDRDIIDQYLKRKQN
jgi:predicted transposase/invertase (TIGR01784 family)